MLTIPEIISATQASFLQGADNVPVSNVSIDSRTIQPGSMYVAIKGAVHDGHKFVNEAIQQGASAVMVSREIPVVAEKVVVLRVDDTVRALGEMARQYRRKFDIPVIAITGSAGKTTVKNLLAHVLSARYKVLKNERSLNNWIGVPLTIFQMRPDHEIAVLELGTNQPGDIGWLAEIAEPTVAVFTNIGDSHLQGLKDRDGVYQEKSTLVDFLRSNGTVVYNADDSYLKRLPSRSTSHIQYVSYSIRNESDTQAVPLESENPAALCFQVDSKQYVLKALGRHQIYNALIGICCGALFGLDYNTIKDRLLEFRLDDNRGNINRCGDIWVCDDSYNANPLSVEASIDLAKRFQVSGRKIFVCGDMLELGEQSEFFHRQVAGQIRASDIDYVYTLGQFTAVIADELKSVDGKHVRHFDAHEDLIACLLDDVKAGDFILVKGSRSMHMEKVVNAIQSKVMA